jgi:hypothetical protein
MRFRIANVCCFVSMLFIGLGFAQIPTFQDIAPSAGVDNGDLGLSAAFLDVNNDGWDDIYLANDHQPGDRNYLFLNQGDSTFTDITEAAGVVEPQFPYTLRIADADNDGWQDLFIFTMDGHNKLYRNNGNNTFTDWLSGSEASEQYLSAAEVGDLNNDGLVDMYVVVRDFYNFYCIIYIATRPGEFEEVWRSTALLWFGCDVQFCDFDNDNDLDILQGNYGTVNWLFQMEYPEMNEIAASAGITGSVDDFKNPMIADYDNDGNFDFFSINYMESGESPNHLFRQDADWHFHDVINSTGIISMDPSYCGVWADLDNDGWLDLLTFDATINNTKFWHSNQDGTFSDVASQAGLTLNDYNTQAVAVGDVNHDGFLDFYTVRYGSTNRLYLNGGNDNHWLQVSLQGTASDRLGIGARVKAVAGDLVQWRDMGGGHWGNCFNAPYVQLGLGNHTVVDSIYVMWLSGQVDILTNVPVDQQITITEGSTSVNNLRQGLVPTSIGLEPPYPNPFNPKTTISYSLPMSGIIDLIVFDITGRKVMTLANGFRQVGEYRMVFDGSSLTSGIYFCKLQAGKFTAVNKMVLLK